MDLFKVLLTGVLLTSPMLYAETVKIYAAASLTNAITDISRLYEQQHRDIQIVPVLLRLRYWRNKLRREPAVIYFSLQTWTG